MAYDIEPICRYGHGPLELQVDRLVPENVGRFMAMSVRGESAILGRGYMFEIWKCKQCSYVELHDFR